MSPTPKLSIVMITADSYETCRRSMGYLLKQTVMDQIEMIIVGPSHEQIAADESELSRFLRHQVIGIGEVKSTGQGLAAGVRAASAPYVVYIEEHEFPPPRLAEVLIREFAKGDAVALGWAMLPANPGLVSWAHIYEQFGAVVAPLTSGPATRLGGHHGAYQRDLLLEYGDNLEEVMANEGVLHGDFQKRGLPMRVIGELTARHTQVSHFPGLLKLEFLGQRSYAASRMKVMNWSVWKRLLYVAGSPLIPFVRLRRSLRHIRRSGRSRELLPQVALVIFAANLAGAAGEALGYLFGPGEKTLSRRLVIELDRYAFVKKSDRI